MPSGPPSSKPRSGCSRSPGRNRDASPASGSPTSARPRSCGTGKPGKQWPTLWSGRIRASAGRCDTLRAAGHEALFRDQTASRSTPTSAARRSPRSSTGRACARVRGRGELAFGTVDSFLIWQLTGGRVHATDVSNASGPSCSTSTDWRDAELCEIVGVRGRCCRRSGRRRLFGETEASILGRSIPIAGCAGDQQAATFGQDASGRGDEGDLRHRRLPPHEHGRATRGLGQRPPVDRRLAARSEGAGHLCARRIGVRRRSRGAMAPRRPPGRS